MSTQAQQKDLVKKWNEWKTEFGKSYPTSEEESKRFEIWKKALDDVTQWNEDLEEEEFYTKEVAEKMKSTLDAESDMTSEEMGYTTGGSLNIKSERIQNAINNKGSGGVRACVTEL